MIPRRFVLDSQFIIMEELHKVIGEEENGGGFFAMEMGAVQVMVTEGRRGGKSGQNKVLVPQADQQRWKWKEKQEHPRGVGRRDDYFRKDRFRKKIKYVQKIVDQPKQPNHSQEIILPAPMTTSTEEQERLNMAYIESYSDTTSEARSCNLMSLLEQAEIQDMMKEDLPMISIDLNPKEARKRIQKVYLETNESKVEESSSCEGELGSDGSIRSLNERSVEMTVAIVRGLEKFKTIQDFKECPKREVLVSLTTNGFVQELKVKSIRLVPLNRVLAINECRKCEILTMNQVEYSLPNNQYREQTKTLSLCWMNVPELGIGQGQEYLSILAGELMRVEVLAIRCACLGKNTVPINTMGIGSESCQRCSMSLKVVLNHITLSDEK